MPFVSQRVFELNERNRGRTKLERRSELRLGADAVHRRVDKKASAARNQRFGEAIILDGTVVLWLSTKVLEYTDLRQKKSLSRKGVAQSDPKPIVMVFLAKEFPRPGEKT